MTLSADRELPNLKPFLDEAGIGAFRDYLVAAATTIYKGGFVGLNAAGYLVMWSKSVSSSVLNGTRFVGVAQEHVDAADVVSNGDRRCNVLVHGRFDHTLTVTVTDIGAPVFCSADDTLSLSPVGNAFVGIIDNVYSTTNVRVTMPCPPELGNNRLVPFVSPAIDLSTADDLIQILPHHHNGLVIHTCDAIVVTTVSATTTVPVVTFQDSDGNGIGAGFTCTFANADAINDHREGIDIENVSGGAAAPLLTAGKALQAKVTTVAGGTGTPGGTAKFWGWALPV